MVSSGSEGSENENKIEVWCQRQFCKKNWRGLVCKKRKFQNIWGKFVSVFFRYFEYVIPIF